MSLNKIQNELILDCKVAILQTFWLKCESQWPVATQWRMFATFPIVVTISCLGGDGGLTSFSTAAVSKITAIRMLTDFRSS